MNIYEKMLAITSEMETVSKNLEVGIGKSAYKAVSEADVLRAVKELEEKYKVYSYPAERKILESSMYDTINSFGKSVNNIFTRIETTYKFVNIEKPDDYITVTSFAEGIDSQDKGSGKAMTYSDKYALMKAYKIVTGEDPDQKASEPCEANKTISPALERQLREKIKNKNIDDIKKVLANLKITRLSELRILDLVKFDVEIAKLKDIENESEIKQDK